MMVVVTVFILQVIVRSMLKVRVCYLAKAKTQEEGTLSAVEFVSEAAQRLIDEAQTIKQVGVGQHQTGYIIIKP